MRKFARESWIKELPKNVCYLYLYDKQSYIAASEAYDGISLNASYTGRAVRFGEKQKTEEWKMHLAECCIPAECQWNASGILHSAGFPPEYSIPKEMDTPF